MKVILECLVSHSLQLNIHGQEPVVLKGEGDKKEFATHGDFAPYSNAAKGLESEGCLKISMEEEGAAKAAPAPAKVVEMKKEEPKAEEKSEVAAEEAPKAEEPKEEAKEEVKKPSSNKKK